MVAEANCARREPPCRALSFGKGWGNVTGLKKLGASLKPLSQSLQVLASSPAEQSRNRDAMFAWRGWYKTSRWQRLRYSILLRDLFTCQWPGCGRIEADKSQLVADHREPHRGDAALFWDEQNLQCLCKPCHDRRKQAEERSGRG